MPCFVSVFTLVSPGRALIFGIEERAVFGDWLKGAGGLPPELAAFTREAERVRELITANAGPDHEELLSAVDATVGHVRELVLKERELTLLTQDEADSSLDDEVAELDTRRRNLDPDDALTIKYR